MSREVAGNRSRWNQRFSEDRSRHNKLLFYRVRALMSGGAGVHRRAHTYIAFRMGNPSEREALTRIAALQCGVGRHRHGGGCGVGGGDEGRKGGGRRRRSRERECGGGRHWRRQRRRLSGSWVSGNVRCRDIRQPPPSHSTALLSHPALILRSHSSSPSVRHTNPIPATEPDRRTTGSSSSSPLIRLSRYRHRRPGNPPRPAHHHSGPPPPSPAPRATPRNGIQPRYLHPPGCCT